MENNEMYEQYDCVTDVDVDLNNVEGINLVGIPDKRTVTIFYSGDEWYSYTFQTEESAKKTFHEILTAIVNKESSYIIHAQDVDVMVNVVEQENK